ncbi:hypothetical protein Ahy_A07g036879 [Arachis hypogaea]|uniref:SWIM-type domain-containing protein n=1 Tax=Arachis hypogaea TaxID=3818 RepID=A0A445CH61_ARAHY|nr:hypothetical protein Ahy_A07g036879 [Arachis hypogaea]
MQLKSNNNACKTPNLAAKPKPKPKLTISNTTKTNHTSSKSASKPKTKYKPASSKVTITKPTNKLQPISTSVNSARPNLLPDHLLDQQKKGKEKVLVEDDGIVVENSDEEVGWLQVLGKNHGSHYDAYDPILLAIGRVKNPPDTEDEFSDEESDDMFPIFSQGARFGQLMLQVGMKFNTKQEFMEAVRDFTIQEGRQIKFRRNESYRVRAVFKWKNEEVKCPWVAYASKDHEETCWKLKTFNNEHVCPRMNKNRAANRKWLAQNLVRKLRKYPNLKRICGLDLNKSSLTRALTDARNATLIRCGDDDYQRFEIHGWPTNMAVDLNKSICTCRFWQIIGMPCVHACATISRINKNPEDFCHHWLIMIAYRATYMYSLNPIPNLKHLKLGEGHETLRRKGERTLMRSLRAVTSLKLQQRHTKRSCAHRKADDIACALAAAVVVVVAKSKSQDGANANVPDDTATTAGIQIVDAPQASEIDITQPTIS